jgi:hypothetical protein
MRELDNHDTELANGDWNNYSCNLLESQIDKQNIAMHPKAAIEKIHRLMTAPDTPDQNHWEKALDYLFWELLPDNIKPDLKLDPADTNSADLN